MQHFWKAKWTLGTWLYFIVCLFFVFVSPSAASLLLPWTDEIIIASEPVRSFTNCAVGLAHGASSFSHTVQSAYHSKSTANRAIPTATNLVHISSEFPHRTHMAATRTHGSIHLTTSLLLKIYIYLHTTPFFLASIAPAHVRPITLSILVALSTVPSHFSQPL